MAVESAAHVALFVVEGGLISVIGSGWRRASDRLAEAERELRDVLAAERLSRGEAEAAAERERGLRSITDSALMQLEQQELLEQVLARLVESSGADAGAVLLMEEGGERLRVTATHGMPEETREQEVPIGEGVAGDVAARRQPRVVADLDQVQIARPMCPSSARSLMAAPLLAEDRCIGVIQVDAHEPGRFADADVRLLELAAERMVLAIERAQLHQAERRAREALEEQVTARTAELRAANEDLEAFTYTAAHELRAPIRGMQGLTEALEEDYAERLDETGRLYLQRLRAAAETGNRLIDDLLRYSRISRADIHLTSVELEPLVEAALKALPQELPGTAEAEIRIERPLGIARANPTILQQVVANLLSNAVKFVPPDRPPRVRIWAEPTGEAVRLWVEDNGIGIAAADHQRIFTMFERLHGAEQYPGTGIGLAIVRRGVEQMGGRFGLESEPDAGSRFWIELPRAEASETTLEQKRAG